MEKAGFLEEGYAGLEEHSRKPLTNSRGIPEPVSVEMLRIKKLHPAWGAKKILEIYKRNHTGKYAPARGSVENLFVRAGYTGVRRRRNIRGGKIIQNRIIPTKPNEVWTVDFNGWWYTKNSEKVNPLTIRAYSISFVISSMRLSTMGFVFTSSTVIILVFP
jgi:hypothetical protein